MIYYICGDDTFNINKRLKELTLDKERVDFDMETVDYSKLMSLVLSIDLFSTPKIYVLENFKGFSNKSEKYSKTNVAHLNQIFSCNEDFIILAKKNINQATTWYKKYSTIIKEEIYNLENLDFEQTLNKFIDEKQIKICDDALELVKFNFEDNILAATNDLEKIWEFTNYKEITKEDVKIAGQQLVEHKIFDLYNLIVTKRTKKAVEYLHTLRNEGISDSQILLTSLTQFRKMYEMKILIEKGVNDYTIAKEIGLNPYAVKYNRKTLRYVTKNRLEMLIKKLADFDYLFKSGQSSDQNLVNMLVIL